MSAFQQATLPLSGERTTGSDVRMQNGNLNLIECEEV
jgi:hypothetical protein